MSVSSESEKRAHPPPQSQASSAACPIARRRDTIGGGRIRLLRFHLFCTRRSSREGWKNESHRYYYRGSARAGTSAALYCSGDLRVHYPDQRAASRHRGQEDFIQEPSTGAADCAEQ